MYHYVLLFHLFTISVYFIYANSEELCPVKCECEHNFTIINCNQFLDGFPTLPNNVERLELSGSNLGPTLGPRYLYRPTLKFLDLSSNGLVNISDGSFRGFTELEHLILSRNYLQYLPNNLFCDNTKLRVLDLSDNLFQIMPDSIFRSLDNLEVFSISNNKLTNLHLGPRWQVSRKLRTIDLSFNNFKNISENAFEFTGFWIQTTKRSLNLRHCDIHHISNGTFANFNGLYDLDLSNNRLSIDNIRSILLELTETKRLDLSGLRINSIESVLSQIDRLSLEYLNLSNNSISSISSASLGNIRSLTHLNMSRNNLTMDINGLKDLSNLISLDISFNSLKSFTSEITAQMIKLINLDISHNELHDSNQVQLSPLTELVHLNLSYNNLDGLVLPGNTVNLQDLIFSNNNISAIYSIQNSPNINHFDVSYNQISHIGPFLFTHTTNFMTANFSNNRITEIDHRSFLASAPHVLDLSFNELVNVKFGSWSNISEINLRGNKIKAITDETFYGMSDLKNLDMSRNKLRNIHGNAFKYLVQLKYLNLARNYLNINSRDLVQILCPLQSLLELRLSSNAMAEINSTVFNLSPKIRKIYLNRNNFTSFSPEIFSELEDLEWLDIRNNPFSCDCDMLDFRTWLDEMMLTKFNISHVSNYLCANPSRHQGLSIFEFEVEDFECNPSLYYTIIVGSVGLFITLVGIIASLIWRYCRKRKGIEEVIIIKKKSRSRTGQKRKSTTKTTKTVLRPRERHDLPKFKAAKFDLPNILTTSPAENWRCFRDRRRPFYVDRYGRRIYVNGVSNNYHTITRYPELSKRVCVKCNNDKNMPVKGGTLPRVKGDMYYCNLCSETQKQPKKNSEFVVPYDKYYWV